MVDLTTWMSTDKLIPAGIGCRVDEVNLAVRVGGVHEVDSEYTGRLTMILEAVSKSIY